MINVLFLQIHKPPTVLSNALGIYYPASEDSRVITGKHYSMKINSDLPDGPFLSGYVVFKNIDDALIVANNFQKEIDKYSDQVGPQSTLKVLIKHYDEGSKNVETEHNWIK